MWPERPAINAAHRRLPPPACRRRRRSLVLQVACSLPPINPSNKLPYKMAPHFSPRTIMTGVGVYFAAAVSGYLYLRSAKAPAPSPCGCGGRHGGEGEEGAASGEAADGQETFDRLADCYDRWGSAAGGLVLRT